MQSRHLVSLIVFGFLCATTLFAKEYEAVKSRSSVKFQAFSTFSDPIGTFNGWELTAARQRGEQSEGSVRVKIDVASLDTGNNKRDTHLKSADFFDVANFPSAYFEAFDITCQGRPKKCTLKGQLEIRGHKKNIQIPVSVSSIMQGAKVMKRIEGKVRLNRFDFGIDYKAPFLMPNKIKKHADVLFDILLKPVE